MLDVPRPPEGGAGHGREASNEHITGERWPGKDERTARLRECVEVTRALFAGEVVDHPRPDHRRPRAPVDAAGRASPLIGPAVSEETARWVGEWADGPVTVNQPRDKLERMTAAFPREAGGEGKKPPSRCTSYAADEDAALDIAHHQWRTNVFPPLRWDLVTVEQFDLAAGHAPREAMYETVLISSDPARHLAALQEFAELGFDEIHLHHVGGPARVHRRLRRARAARAALMRLDHTSDLWWKNAVVYCLDVETFLDSDGDGVGDFDGLIAKIDYLCRAATCLWLMPFHPRPGATTATTSATTTAWTRGWGTWATSSSSCAPPTTAASR